MRRWQNALAGAAVLLGILPAAPAEGSIRPHAFTLSPMAGGYFFESDQDLKTSPVFTLGLGYSFTERWTGEIVTGYIDTQSDTGDKDQVDGFPLRLDVLYHWRPASRLVPYLALGFGGLWLDDRGGSTDIDTVFGYGGGVKLFLTESIALRADVRHLYILENLYFNDAEGQNNLTAVAGLSFQFGGDVDPPPQVDSDGDGIIDSFDRCPDTTLGVPVDGYGCPADADHDGIHDYLDRCPGTPAGARVNRDGCPQDGDRDGVPNYLDKCPDTVGFKVDERGCPLDDRDGDTIVDERDRCPDTPAGKRVDPSGCSEEPPAPPPAPSAPSLQPPSGALSLQLEFAPASAQIRPGSEKELARAVDFIKANPGSRIAVEGHTDSVGPAEVNLEISRRRAESVRRYLLETAGISPERIRAAGYGESRPVGDNATQEGRQRNRRVVISVEK